MSFNTTSNFFGTQQFNEGGGSGTMTFRQKIALTIMIGIAIFAIVLWWLRRQPKDIVFLGPVDVGPGKQVDPDRMWVPLMNADQIAKTSGNNITCSFFVYVKASSVSQVPMNNDGSYRFNYVLTVGNTMGITIDPSRQICTVDILQSSPAKPRGTTIAAKNGLEPLRTLEVANVAVSKWNQVTVCVEGRSVDVYLNGKLATSAILDNVPVAMFSGLMLNGSPDFDGQLCLFQVWKERRTSSQILENYQKHTDLRGKPNVPDPELTFAGAWERFLKASCEKTGICGFPVRVGPMQYVEYEFA